MIFKEEKKNVDDGKARCQVNGDATEKNISLKKKRDNK